MWKCDVDARGLVFLSNPQQFGMCGVPEYSVFLVPESEGCIIMAMAIAKAAQTMTE